MTGFYSGSPRIDPRLIQHFALVREPGPGPDGPLDEAEREVIATKEEIWADALARRKRWAAAGLIFNETRRVVLDPERVMLVIPGSCGLHLFVQFAKNFTAGGGAKIEGLVQGRPVLSCGQALFGLAPDGVDRQRVEFRDGSTGYAIVRHNTWAIDDPSWKPE